MYGIFTYNYHKNQQFIIGKYTIHGSYGYEFPTGKKDPAGCFEGRTQRCSHRSASRAGLCVLEIFNFFTTYLGTSTSIPIGSMGLVYIYLHEWLIFMVNVGRYTSPMDPMGFIHGCLNWMIPNLYMKMVVSPNNHFKVDV